MEKSYEMSKLMLWIGILILNLKRNQFAAACQIDYFLKTEWDKDILTAMHSIGQLLNYHVRRKHQQRGKQHLMINLFMLKIHQTLTKMTMKGDAYTFF